MKFFNDYFAWLDRIWKKADRSWLGRHIWWLPSFMLACFGFACGLVWVVFLLTGYLLEIILSLFGIKLPRKSPKRMTGEEFERHVADKLRARGYHDVRFTPATGDYGVDILATKHGRVYAFQCKCYTGSVGVSAVQEVYSGSRKYKADRAVVITNSKYTPNAKTLAHDLGVSLWDLEVLDSIFCE